MRSARCGLYASMLIGRLDSGNRSSCLYHVLRHIWGSLSRSSVYHTGSWGL